MQWVYMLEDKWFVFHLIQITEEQEAFGHKNTEITAFLIIGSQKHFLDVNEDFLEALIKILVPFDIASN